MTAGRWIALAAPLLLAIVGMSCGGAPVPDPERASAAPTVKSEVLARAISEWPGVTIEVTEASRDSGTLLVRLRFANTSTQPFEFGDRFAADPADRDTLADVSAAEPGGRRKYFVLRDRANRPDCSRDLSPLQPGETRLLFARFPAPLAGTSRITIQVPHVPELPDLPLSSGGRLQSDSLEPAAAGSRISLRWGVTRIATSSESLNRVVSWR